MKRKISLNFQASNFRLQRGISIYLAVVVMSVLLGIGLGVSALLVGQIKTIRGVTYSVTALYAADTGVEAELNAINEPPFGPYYNYLDLDGDGGGLTGDCSTLVDSDDACYQVELIEEPDCVGTGISYYIQSIGTYKGTKRAIELSIPAASVAIILDSPYALDWVWAETGVGAAKGKDASLWVATEPAPREVPYRISLIKWNLLSIPDDVTIQSATFFFYDSWFSGTGGAFPQNVNLRSVSDANDGWASGDPINNLYNLPANDPPIASFGDFPAPGQPVGWKSANITSLVQNEINPATGNDTLSLKWDYSAFQTDAYGSPSGTNSPYITITYNSCD